MKLTIYSIYSINIRFAVLLLFRHSGGFYFAIRMGVLSVPDGDGIRARGPYGLHSRPVGSLQVSERSELSAAKS